MQMMAIPRTCIVSEVLTANERLLSVNDKKSLLVAWKIYAPS